ncbi:hypothetical protein IPZ60_10430 [Psychrobacter sp. NG25]|uniref:hypothetical protein n=1 Tax=Psychrobacter sp. NG25 TaxID=2782005 RepID=UPI001883A421|nr:hypothetical protein [Psychrobacter sp. NG25]MBF0659158.1 hypothetical protein [Psychrobacter sp. NG25]
MITLSAFQEYLSSAESLPPLLIRAASGQESYLLKLLENLPSQTQIQQVNQLEKMLTVLRVANIDEQQRLKLMIAVIGASDKLVAALRQHFIYEPKALNSVQLGYVNQIKSLYYLIIMAYDRVTRYKISLLNSQQKYTASNGWQRYFNGDKSSSTTLAIAIYQTLLMYQRLLFTEALCYQKPSSYLWAKINQLYYLAYQYHAAEVDLSKVIDTQYANNIHRLYCQICLHSLLNVRAMRRPNILVVQRLLSGWAEYIVATIEPQTETRIYVDLQSNKPPSYLTANSIINPYEDRYHCLFIELDPMLEYFDSRSQALIREDSEGLESYLLQNIATTIRYRYLKLPLAAAPKRYTEKEAVLITGFNNIHYRVSHSQSFAIVIAKNELPDEHQPRYDTFNKKQDSSEILASEIFDRKGGLSLFRTLSLSAKADKLDKENSKESHSKDAVTADDDVAMTAPPPLHVMSLLLVCRSDTTTPPDWSLGVVRWLSLDIENPEVDWQILGHQLVACGLRLEGTATRSQHFIPAFILGREAHLQTTGTLIVPTSYFQTDDRVIMRINTKQTLLRLGKRLLITDEFSQYEVVQL